MRIQLLLATVAGLFAHSASAVFADEAWNLDYHYALIGEPQTDATFFHQPNPESKASLLYTLSNKGVLGAVNPRDGSVVWRQLLAGSSAPSNISSFLRAGEGQDIVISGIDSHVAAWSAGDGKLVWTSSTPGTVEDVEILQLDDTKTTGTPKDVVVLSRGEHAVVERRDGASGAVKWQYKHTGSDIPYQLSASAKKVFVVLLHKTMLGYFKIKVVTLDSGDGRALDEYTLSSENELASPNTIISIGASAASPIVAWTDAAHSVLKVNLLGTKAINSFNIEKDGQQAVESIQIHAPYYETSVTHFLVHFATATSHWAEVFHIDVNTGKVLMAYSLPKLDGQGAFATSTSGANVYFTRVTESEILTFSSLSSKVLNQWSVGGFGVAAGPDEQIFPVNAVAEVSFRGDAISAIRTAVLLSTGDWVLLRDGASMWQRPEALAGTVSATFAIPAQVEGFVLELEKEAHINPVAAYIHRVTRHLLDLRRLPASLLSLPQRFMEGFLGTSADDASSDAFGFHKIIACATDNGRLIAIDAGNPHKTLWSRKTGITNILSSSLRSTSSGALSLIGEPGSEARLFNATTGEALPALPSSDSQNTAEQFDVEYSMQGGRLVAHLSTLDRQELWHFQLTTGERIVSLVSRPVNDPVASIGKVLGDRRVLYKYLNPSLALLATAHDASNTINIYVLDTISGSILYTSSYSNIDLTEPIASTMSENWFAVSFTAEALASAPKGQYIVVGELFESLVPNDRGPLNAAANFSTISSSGEPFTLIQTYHIPEAISRMTVTQTRQGITSRALLAVLADSHAIVSIPYAILDPRRPVNRDPTTDEQMEGLMRYAPTIDFNPQWYLNHRREVMGISNVITTPALIESTSIVFAYGLDIFGTRLSPSFSFDILGKDFNKFQMLSTVGALFVGTLVVAPLVMRKQINLRWSFT